MLFRALVGSLAATLAVQAVPEQQPGSASAARTPDCADFDPREPVTESWAAGLSAPSSHRGLQSGCASLLSTSAIAAFDALIAQHDVMCVAACLSACLSAACGTQPASPSQCDRPLSDTTR
jgi:hypothetical protein